MTRLLPALHEGHAPIFLHQAFQDALDAYEEWGLDQIEPTVEFDGKTVPISSVFGRMRSCTDQLPARTLDAVKVALGDRASGLASVASTYSEAALVLRAAAVERLRAEAA